uniref:DUF1618 domain-containing protein n=1 Tax=Oryza punctata TaxID=4537 RepID=A0A0E0JUJ9_ORYPU
MPSGRGAPRMVLVDRYVRFVDDLKRGDQRNWRPSSTPSRSAATKKRGKTKNRTPSMRRSYGTGRRSRSRRTPSSVTALQPLARCARSRSPPGSYYREVLDGIDPRFPQLTGSVATVNSLTIGVSWPPGHHLWSYPFSGFISSSHGSLLALYLGAYRPGIPCSPGCYLVLDTCANSVAIIPPLRTTCITTMSHCGIGTGVAVLRHNNSSDYVLVELFLHQDTRTHLASNRATLFFWWSPGPGPLADGPVGAERGATTPHPCF